MPYLNGDDHKQLRSYKYVSGTYTFMDNLLNPVYTNINNLFPTWLAPNVITLLGLLFSMSSTIVYMYYKPSFEGTAPSWVYYYAALCVILYQAFDFMDGKQARRLGVSGPLGELFDHGCDALNLFFIFINFSCAMNFGIGKIFQFTFIMSVILFYFAQLNEYKTGVLLHSNNNIGVTEVQLSISILNLLPGIFGDNIYQLQIPYINVSFTDLYVIVYFLITGTSIIFIVYFYHDPKRGIKDKEMKGNKNIDKLIDVISKPLSFYVYLACVIYLFNAPSQTLVTNPRLFSYVIGITFVHTTTTVVICHVAKKPLHAYQSTVLPILAIVLSELLGWEITPYVYVLASLVISYFYLSFIITVITELTRIFDIYCFRIKQKKT